MPARQQRPLREMCQTLTIVQLVKAGLPTWGANEAADVELLGPEHRGIRTNRPWDRDFTPLRADIERFTGRLARGTLQIGHPYPGAVWCDEVPVRIPPYTHWTLVCQGCNRQCRALFWPPGGASWACRRCHGLRYPDRRRLATLPPRPNAVSELDALERDIRRLKLLTRGTARALRQLEALREREEHAFRSAM